VTELDDDPFPGKDQLKLTESCQELRL